MKLLRLHVENFGGLQDFDLEPAGGLNILYQKNGWGKSTLAVFIKAMLYGLPATTKRQLDENERKKYTPWQGGAFGGSLEFSTARGSFRVERFFGAKESADTFALYDLSTNLPSTAYSASLGEELFGIDADGFERSTYLSQRAVGTKDNNSIAAKLGNLLDDVGDIGNYDVAMEALDKRRRYYVMTGNRGAIAEGEQEKLNLEAELERCRSIEAAVEAQEAELADCYAKITATQAMIRENHDRLERAGLARERAALVEQKKTMQAELASLRTRYEATEEFFHGATPTVEELREYCDLHERIKEVNAERNLLVRTPTAPERLGMLRRQFGGQTPSDAALSAMERDSEELRDLQTRRRNLVALRDRDEWSTKFPHGVPTDRELEAMKHRREQVETRRRELEVLPKEPPRAPFPTWLLAGVLLLAVGALLTVLSFLPSAQASVPLLCAGIGTLAVGAVLSVLGFSRRSRAVRTGEEQYQNARRLQGEIASESAILYSFLEKNGVDPRDSARGLAELSLLIGQYRAWVASRARVGEELAALEASAGALSQKLCAGLSRYYSNLSPRDDYRTELERLRRDASLYVQMEGAEQKRLSDLRAVEGQLVELKESLTPFLAKYDPHGRMSAGDCLQRIGEMRSERNRLAREIANRERALESFVKEKKLGENEGTEGTEVYEQLRTEGAELQSRLADLQRKYATHKSTVERLSAESDRIPELERQIATLNVRLSADRANSATVQHTQKLLEEAKVALSTRYLDGMQAAFRKYLERLTGSAEVDSVMDPSFAVSLREGGKTHPMDAYSRGWRDAVEFCVRLSLTEALYAEGEKPFLLLDDPFVNLDDARLVAARSMLEQLADEYQIFYFVCHKERI